MRVSTKIFATVLKPAREHSIDVGQELCSRSCLSPLPGQVWPTEQNPQSSVIDLFGSTIQKMQSVTIWQDKTDAGKGKESEIPSLGNRVAASVVFLVVSLNASWICAEESPTFGRLQTDYEITVHPVLKQYCLDCHSTEKQEGELDLERFASLAEVRRDVNAWQKVAEMLDNGEMPPEDSKQPGDAEREQLRSWVRSYLNAEALSQAGDPGPVILRRLSNMEYTYTIRDLTGVDSLDPAREFPVDGAAGEGFTNVGSALVMSPGLLTKYLDAAKQIAKHALLLPEGIRFSGSTSSRDWTDETLTRIREFYAAFSESGGGSPMNLQGIQFETNSGGRLEVDRYLAVLQAEREALTNDKKTIAAVAHQYQVNAKYLGRLWEMLHAEKPSLLLDALRAKWRESKLTASDIRAWQQALWRFTSVGHIGKVNGPKAWQEPVTPLATRQELRVKLAVPNDGGDAMLYLSASDAGDGNENDVVIWERPSLVIEDHRPIPLGDVSDLIQRMEELANAESRRTAQYLQVIATAVQTGRPIEDVSKDRGLNANVLENWVSAIGVGSFAKPIVKGHYADKMTNVGGYADIRGWGFAATPSLIANKNADTIRFSTLTIPGRSVNMHPSPDKDAIIFWQSPIDGNIRIDGLFADSDGVCGNGAAWRVEWIGHDGADTIVSGEFDNGKRSSFSPDSEISVRTGDLIKLVVSARDNNHSCDTTQVQIVIREQGGKQRVWDLANDVVDRVQESNPLADSFGNLGVWHFCDSSVIAAAKSVIPVGSTLALWRASLIAKKPEQELTSLAQAVEDVIAGDSSDLGESDQSLRAVFGNPRGPMKWLSLAMDESPLVDMEVQAPSLLEFKVPAELAAAAEVVVSGTLHPTKGKQGSVQLQLLTSKPETLSGIDAGQAESVNLKGKWTDHNLHTIHSAPVIVSEGSAARQRFEAAFDDFRQLFPAALCYTKIVPVDEVVTLTLYYREDNHLKRLMLDDDQSAQLDQLWDQLMFVSRAPLKQVDAFDQLYQYATQDADPSAFEPLRQPIRQQAASFQRRLIESEPVQLQAVLQFAASAWRRPLESSEQDQLRALYQTLRAQDLSHDAAVRQLLARLLVAPAFLYRGEQAAPGTDPAPVSDWELATRLSYFLWSSAPDNQLRALAAGGKLTDPDVLAAQAQRMLQDDKIRRLATEFGAQWLHVRDVQSLDEKNERLFPDFVSLRAAMQEEAVRFFIDLFQHDRSLLSLLDADHSFVNGPLAKHYGIQVTSEDWQRVDGFRERGRGGILGFSSVLAKQSGASRTSPILRGNWISEVVLGEKLPRPPKDVPVLPDQAPQGLTERQLIERHSGDKACARCHERIDPFGFALEGFDAIGRARSKDASGLVIDTTVELPDGTKLEGVQGLRNYLLNTRRDDCLRQFCRKIVGYALGRSVQLSDQPLLDKMLADLQANDYRVAVAVDLIVRSPQFRQVRGRDKN